MRLSTRSDSLLAEYSNSPVPVYEYNKRDWLTSCKELPFPSGLGVFCFSNTHDGFPPEFIVINRNLANYKKLAVYRHELAHHDCHINGCKCFEPENYEVGDCEYHAIVKAMVQFMNEELISPLLFTMEFVVRSLFSQSKIPFFGAVKTIRNPLWADAVELAGDKYQKWLEKHPFVLQKIETVRCVKPCISV